MIAHEQVERVRFEEVRRPDATVNRLVVLLADARYEAVAEFEIEIHGFLVDKCSTYDTTNTRRFATL